MSDQSLTVPVPALPVARTEPSVGEMLQAVIERGVTQENVVAIERLVGLYERMQERRAEQLFAEAFVKLQAQMPKVQATRAVPDRSGGVRYRFAPLEEIVRQIGPALKENGFTFSFSERFDAGRMIESCTLMHVGGHKRTNEFSVRVGGGPPGCTETQADGAASQYARRYALCDSLGIVIEHLDEDARLEGGTVTKEQAEDLARRVAETNSDRAAFLKFAGAKDFFSIMALKFDMLDQFLTRKERKGK